MRNRIGGRSRRRENPRRSPGFRPDLTGWSGPLEARTLLATITVTTTTDEFDVPANVTVSTLGTGGSDGKISLREAVVAATNTAGANEIDLPAGTYNLGNVGTGELMVGNISGQNITIKGLGTPANTIINQTVVGNRIFNYDNNQVGSIAGSLLNLTIQGATNVNRLLGGGAILAGGPGDSLSLTNCVVQNNSTANGSLSVGRNGGAISYSGGGNLSITNSVFSNNTAGGNPNSGSVGGAIVFNNSGPGNLTISNSTFANNSATGVRGSLGGDAGGGALIIAGSGTATITASTFTGNSAGTVGSTGGAIRAESMTFNISGSRFFNNTAASGTGIEYADAAITANDDWWGADAFPGAAGTDTVVKTNGGQGSATINTRLALALSPAASTIGTGATTGLTAKIVSTSAPTVAVAGTALEGLNLSFAPGTLGSVSPMIAAIVGGTAGTTFSSGATPGTTSPSVSLDNGTKTTSITIVGAPTANSQSVNVAFNTARAITLTGSDPNTPPRSLTYTVAANPAHGTLSGTAPNLTYTPTAGYYGADSFTFTVSNGFATSNTATVSLTVAAGVPTANPQTASVGFNTAKAITLTGSDPDIPPLTLTFAVATNPAHGTLSGFNAATGAVTYTPTAGYHGADSFTFTVNNGSNTSNTATVSLTVAAGVPTANPQSASVNQDGSVGLTLTGSDPDVPPLGLTFAVATGPAHGTLSGFNAATGAVTYTPNAGYFGPDTFQFTVNNGSNTSPAATVSLGVVQAAAATVSGTVGVTWGTSGTASLQTDADGLRLLPAGRNTDLPWLGIGTFAITLSRAATLSAGDVTVTGVNVANYGPVTIVGSGTSYTIKLARPIDAADRVTLTIGNANIATFTRRLDVLPGDFNDDGGVTMQDAIGIRNEYLGFASAVPTVSGDIDGNGVVDVNDYNAARRLIGTRLP